MSVPILLSEARAYTAGLTTTAGSAMADAISSVRAVGYTIPGYFPATLPTTPPSSISFSVPTFDQVTLDLPTEPPTAPAFQDISDITIGTLPELTASAPTISLPTKPNQLGGFTETLPPINTSIVFPDPPSELLNPLLTAPTLPDRVEPDAPSISLPGFTAIAPVDTTVVPTDYESRFAKAYASAAPSTIAMMDGYVDAELTKMNPLFHSQMDAIEAQLTKYLVGGTALSATAETAIYERSRAKASAEARRTQDEAWAAMAERGFTMPNGSQLSAIRQARQGAADNNASAGREIVAMQAEMEQKNLQFAVTTSVGLRTAMLDAALKYHQNLVTINGQALEYAKSVLSAIIEVYNTAVKAFSVKLDAYRAETAVYEVRLKAAMSYIELYQAEINALAALVNMDHAKVDIYRAKIEALTSRANLYRAQIEAVQGQVSLQKLQLDVFQSKVQAYTAQVQGKNAEWQGYAAAIEGETARVRIYGEQVQAFGAQVSGYKAIIEAGAARVQAQAATNAARAANYSSTLAGYSTIIQARGDKAKITLENQRQVLSAFNASIQAAIGNAQVQNEYYRSVSGVAVSNAELRMRAQVETGNATRAFGDTIARLGTANATIYANLAQAGLSGMNTLSAETLAS